MRSPTVGQVSKCFEVYEKLCNSFSPATPDEVLRTIYFILRPLPPNVTFTHFIKSVIYVGVGPMTRAYDHIILTDFYAKCCPQLNEIGVSDLKHDEIKKVFNEGGKPLVIRCKMKSQAASICFENGVISSIGLSNLHGNKTNSSTLQNPTGFSQKSINAACAGLLYDTFNLLVSNFDTITQSDSALMFNSTIFEMIDLNKLLANFSFPVILISSIIDLKWFTWFFPKNMWFLELFDCCLDQETC